MGKFRFSVIILIDDIGMHIRDAIDSVISQDLDFTSNVQLILANDGSVDDFSPYLEYQDKYPENVILLSQKFTNYSQACNTALKHAKGEIVNFLHNNDTLSRNALNEVLNAFDNYGEDVVDISRKNLGKAHEEDMEIPDGIIDLIEKPEYAPVFLNSLFIRRDAMPEFNESLDLFENTLFIDELLLKFNSYAFINSAKYLFRKRRDTLTIKNKEHFNRKFDYMQAKVLTSRLLDEKTDVPIYIQSSLLKALITMINKDITYGLLESDETAGFFDLLKNALGYIEKDLIYEMTSNISMSGFFIAIKNDDVDLSMADPLDSLEAEVKPNDVLLYSKGDVIDELSKRDIYIDFADLKNDIMSISGHVKSIFDCEHISVYAVKKSKGSDEIIQATSFKYPTRYITRFLSINWQKSYNFDIKIPLGDATETSSVELKVKYDDGNSSCILDNGIKFRRHSNITYDSHYYIKDSRIVMFNGMFNIMPFSYRKMIQYEVKGLLKLFGDKYDFYRRAIFIRTIHLILFPFMRNRKIWIVMDRIDQADDNGEHFFRYAVNQDDGIEKYFVIDRESPDYARLKDSYENIVEFESLKNKILYLFADKLISSQGSEFYLSPFKFEAPYLTAGTAYLDFYFLQHGIILHDLSSWLVKYERHPRLIVTSSRMEYDSLISDLYNYDDGVFRLLGLPRYDNLDNSGYKSQIVIMPTWRNYIHNEEDLLESEYFSRFNSFLNNERLIDYARSHGYEILFKPHPELAKYIGCFDKNDYVQIDNDKKYQEIFNESAILVTDYSSIFFDFAYLKKPVIYYHYGDDFHFESDEGYFKYDTMGFGSVVESEDDLVNRIIDYIDNGAEMEDVYKRRVDEFFQFHDRDNSRRCYDAILKD